MPYDDANLKWKINTLFSYVGEYCTSLSTQIIHMSNRGSPIYHGSVSYRTGWKAISV